jgi:signal transduction histidine kinase
MDGLGPQAVRVATTLLDNAGPWMLLAAGYYFAARLGEGFRFLNSQIGVVWPPNAVLLSALLLVPKRRWWLVFLVTALAHGAALGASTPVWRLMWQIALNSVYTATSVAALRRLAGQQLHFGNPRQVVTYIGVVFSISLMFALVTPVFVRSLFDYEQTYSAAAALCRALLSNATGMLLVTPVVVQWGAYGTRPFGAWMRPRAIEAVALTLSLLVVGLIAFGTGPQVARFPWLLLLVVPPLLWAAVRLGPIGASTALLVVASLSLWGTAHQLGPFVLIGDADRVLTLELFWIALCPPIMMLAAVIRERDVASDALRDQRNQLAHVARVATAGELSIALGHELGQPLTSMMASAKAGAYLLARPNVDVRELRSIFEDIVRQNKQAADIVSRVRTLLKYREPRFEILSLDSVARDALTLARAAVGLSGIDVQTELSPELPRVRGDPVQLLQVVLNLVVNACESMDATPAPGRRLRLKVAPVDREHVEVLITDRGVGLPVGRENQVFEPFYTTKDAGLGLGLSIGRTIASAHGGRLWGENNPQGGATFHLVLPTADASATLRAD